MGHFPGSARSHTRKKAIPIKKNRVLQTGANKPFGGKNSGLTNPAYHVGIDGVVNNEPMNPASSGMATEMINFQKLFNFILRLRRFL